MYVFYHFITHGFGKFLIAYWFSKIFFKLINSFTGNFFQFIF